MPNKFPFHRILVLLAVFSLNLAACNTAPALIPTAAMPLETLKPTATATEDVPPTATEYIPAGATGKDKDGNWTTTVKTEKGNTLTYTLDKERLVLTREIFYGPIIPASLESKPYGLVGDLMLRVTIDKTIAGELQLQTILPHQKWEPYATANWSNLFRDLLDKHMENAGIIPNANDVDLTPFIDGSHKWHFDFKTAEGPQSEGLWDSATTTVHLRGDFNQLQKTKPIGFSEVSMQNPLDGPVGKLMIRIRTKDGNTEVDIASSIPASQWTPQYIMYMFMYSQSVIMDCAGSAGSGQVCDLSTLPNGNGSLGDFISNMKHWPLFDLAPAQ